MDGLQLTNSDIETLVTPLEKCVLIGQPDVRREEREEEDREMDSIISSSIYMNGASNHIHEDLNSAAEDLQDTR